jgi:fluoride exporter
MTKLLVIGCGGFIGAVARYGLTFWIESRWVTAVPLGTMAVNVLGCFALGFLMAYVAERPGWSPEALLFLRVGLLGAFTTFSTLGFETVELLERGQWRAGLLSMGGHLLLGLLAVVIGAFLAHRCFEA